MGRKRTMRRPNAEALEEARKEARVIAERLRVLNAGFLPGNKPLVNFAETTPVPDEDPLAGVEELQETEETRMAADDSPTAKPEIEVVYAEEDPPEIRKVVHPVESPAAYGSLVPATANKEEPTTLKPPTAPKELTAA